MKLIKNKIIIIIITKGKNSNIKIKKALEESSRVLIKIDYALIYLIYIFYFQ